MTTGSNNPGVNKPVRLLRITLLSALLIILVATGLLLNDNVVRTLVELSVSKLTGRELSIRGDFEFSLGASIEVRGSDLVWENAPWADNPYMLTLESAEVSIDTGSLLNPPVVIASAKVNGGELDLSWADDRPMNWFLVSGTKKAGPDKPIPESLPLLLSSANLNDFSLSITHPNLNGKLQLYINTAEHLADAENNLVIKADTEFGDEQLLIDGLIGPFPNLIVAGSTAYEVRLSNNNARVHSKGHTDQLRSLTNPEFYIKFFAKEANIAFRRFHIPTEIDGNIDIFASLQRHDDQLLIESSGNIGEINIDASINSKSLTNLSDFFLKVDASGPSSAKAAKLFRIEGLPDAPFSIYANAFRSKQGIELSEIKLETEGASILANGVIHKLPELKDIDLNLDVRLASLQMVGNLLRINGLPDLPVTATATIEGNGLDVPDQLISEASIGGITFAVDAELTEVADFTGSTFSARINSSDPRDFFSSIGLPLTGPVNLNASANALLEATRIQITGLQAAAGNLRFTLDGQIGLSGDSPGSNFDFTFDAPDLNTLGANIAWQKPLPNLPVGPVNIVGEIEAANKAIYIRTRQGSYQDNQFSFNGSLSAGEKTPDIDADITLQGPDLSHLLKSLNLEYADITNYAASTHLTLSESGLRLSKLNFRIKDNGISGEIYTAWPLGKSIGFDLAGEGQNLKNSLPALGNYTPPSVPFSLSTKGEFTSARINVENFNARVGKAGLDISGLLELQPKVQATRIDVDIRGPDLTELGRIDGLSMPQIPFRLVATVEGDEQRSSADDLTLELGRSRLQGKVKLQAGATPALDVRLTSELLDLEPFQADPDANQAAEKNKDARFFSSEPLNYAALKRLDAQLDIRIDKLLTADKEVSNLTVDAALNGGQLDIKRIKADTREGDIDLSLSLNADTQKLTGDIRLSDIALASREMTSEQKGALPKLQFSGDFDTNGNSPAEMAGNMTGHLWINIGPGIRPELGLDFLMGDFVSVLLETLNPFYESTDKTVVSCGGIYLEAQNGILETAPAFIIQTDKISIGAKGIVDLRTEKINLVFNTTALKGIGLSASDIVNPFIKLGGTLSNPRIVANPTDAAIKGGAAVATLGLSVVGSSLWKRWVQSKDACEKIEAEALKIRSGIEPDNIPGWINDLVD